jgi:2,3-bisphosphoglycerate-dependent phosphoglycerate mutase
VTHVYLIRHAQQFSAHNDQGLLLADHEDGLTEKGHTQARRLAERVVHEIQPDVLYSSSLLRARQTARHVGDATGLPLNIDPDLAELRLNCPPDVSAAVEFDGWVRARRYPYTPAFPGGEALTDLHRRGAQAFDRMSTTHQDKSIVVVTHGGLIEMVFYYLLGIPIERNLVSLVHCDYTSLFHWRWLEIKDLHLGGWDLLAVNDTHHLDDVR